MALASFLANDQGFYLDFMEVKVLPEVVDIVAGLEKIAGGNFSKLCRGVIVISVDGEDGQSYIEDGLGEVGLIRLSVEGDMDASLVPPGDLILQHSEAAIEAVVGGIDFIEQIPSKE